MKRLILLTISTILLNTAIPSKVNALSVPIQTLGDLKSLLVTEHEIRLRQGIREIEKEGGGTERVTFYYDIKEEISLKNIGESAFKETLLFWGDISEEDADEVSIELIRNGSSSSIKEFTVENNQIKVPLSEEQNIQPGETASILLKYRIFFVGQGQEEKWEKKILYNHKPGSLTIKFNPVGSAEFRPTALKINLGESETEDGWFESGPLSPEEIGTTYVISTTKEKLDKFKQKPTSTPEVAKSLTGDEPVKELPKNRTDIEYPKRSGPNKLLIGLIGMNIVLVATVIFLTVRNTKNTD